MGTSSREFEGSRRAGRYVNQPRGFRAFIPAPLPPQPAINLDGDLQVLLSKADLALGRLDGSIQTLPNSDLFVYMYVRKEAVLSSQIEGTQSSLQDVLAAEAQILSPTRPRDVDEVVNYVAAMNHGLARLPELPVSVRLIREIHALLLQGVRGSHLTPGELRTSQNWIGPAGCTLADASFVPPPPHEVPEALGNLERFLHSDSQLPLLIKIGLAHAQSLLTHGHVHSQVCCALYVLVAKRLLESKAMNEAWERAEQELATLYHGSPYAAALDFVLEGKSREPQGSGYVVDSLWSAKSACEESTFVGVVKAAVALGNDTDTTACIAGGLAGIHFGFDGIPLRWMDILRGRDLVKPLERCLLLRG